MNHYIKKFSPLLILLGSIGVFVIMVKLKPEAEFQKPEVTHQLVEVLLALPQDVEAKISSQGTIRPEHEIVVTSEVTGKVTGMEQILMMETPC